MRRFLVIVMMLLLPFQATWAVAAGICNHETGKASHFGHHEHEHHSAEAAAPEAEDADAQPGGFHADCGVCHGVGTAVTDAASQTSGAWSERDYAASYSAYLPEPPLETLIRPPLSFVA
jgi:hypothetical protein